MTQKLLIGMAMFVWSLDGVSDSVVIDARTGALR
jgi:hypothetical protein